MIRVLVTGANGQLGKSIHKVAHGYPELRFFFKNSNELDITDGSQVKKIFAGHTFQYCINCAAYTNVEMAESEQEKAFAVNAQGVSNIADACLITDTILFHISTDYVFDGEKRLPYTVADAPNPINVYGASKLKGEELVQEKLQRFFIIRTSWLYSEFGKNFYKTILQKAKTEEVLHITDEQRGCPTHAHNLAKSILELIVSGSKNYGIHHFTDGNAISWYGFAKKILRENGLEKKVRLEKAKNYRTFARRPKNSVLKIT